MCVKIILLNKKKLMLTSGLANNNMSSLLSFSVPILFLFVSAVSSCFMYVFAVFQAVHPATLHN